jgi:hypothetical protein
MGKAPPANSSTLLGSLKKRDLTIWQANVVNDPVEGLN